MWEKQHNKLYKKFIFKDFASAFSFMTQVGMIAEKINHHPTWTNTWNTVEIWLSTHDAGNVITEKDENFARLIDAIL
jgi:4a-hydroxytetrahydrobiopterin dehydratase